MTTLQQHEYLFELVNDSVMTRTIEGRINFWNHSAEELYGWRKEEAIGRVSHDLLRTQFPKPLEEIESELVRNGLWEGKLVHTTRDGGCVAVESRWSLDLKGQSGAVVEINTRSTARIDKITTERKQRQDLVEQTATTLQQHEYLFELVNDSVMTRTIEGRINFWNHSAEELYGWRKEEAIGRVSHNLLRTQFPKPLEEIESELVRNGLWEGKLVHTTRDGGCVVVESRWSLDLKGQSGAVVEINARSADFEVDPDARTDSYGVEIGRQEPPSTSKLAKVGNLLPKFANIVLAGGGLLCVLALLYFVYYYAWTGQRQFTSRMGVLPYYISPALLAILLFASLRIRKSRRINLALVLFSSGVSIYALESLLTVWSNLPSVGQDLERMNRAAAANALGIEFDTRTKTQVVDDLRRRGIDAVLSVSPKALLKEQNDGTMKSVISINGTEVLPLAGMDNKLVVVCNEGGQFLTYRSDQHGFNNPQQVWHTPIDIVAVGDSFTQGWCVAPDINFVSLIRQRYPGTLNLGIEGNGPLVMLAALKEYAEIVRPKLVLWFYFEGNDLSDLNEERLSPLLNRYLTTNEFSQHLSSRQAEIDHALSAYLDTVTNKNQLLVKLEEISAVIADTDKLPGALENIAKLSQLRQRLGLIYGVTTNTSHEVVERTTA